MSKTNHSIALRRPKLPRAQHGSKRDWATVCGAVPPEVYNDLDSIAVRERKHQTDLIHEAVELLIASRKAA